MKRKFAKPLIIGTALCMLPFSAMALESITDEALGSMTGQAGVSIAVDDIVIYQTGVADVTYTDTDGTTSYVGFNPTGNPPVLTTTTGDITKAGIMLDYHDDYKKLILIDAILDDQKYGVEKMNATMAASLGVNVPTVDDTPDQAGDVKSVTFTLNAAGELEMDVTTMVDDGNGNGNLIEDSNITTISGLNPNFANLIDKVGILPSADLVQRADWDASIGQSVAAREGFLNGISPLSIDVGTCEALSKGLAWNTGHEGDYTAQGALDVAGVVIGLPTVEITQFYESDTMSVKIVADTSAVNGGAFGNNEFIEVTKSGYSQMAILGGRVEIAPH